MPHTFQTVADLIQQNWESDLPDKVLEALKPLNGKMVTTRILDKLPGGKDVWLLERKYGMTSLTNRPYYNTDGRAKDGVSLLLAHTEASFPLDVQKVEKDNPAYFSARKARNHARMEAMNSKELLDRMAAVLNRVEAAKAELKAAISEFDELAEYDAPFHQDSWWLERVCGLLVKARGSGETRIQLD